MAVRVLMRVTGMVVQHTCSQNTKLAASRQAAKTGPRAANVLGSELALGAHEGITGKPVKIRRGPATVSEGASLRSATRQQPGKVKRPANRA